MIYAFMMLYALWLFYLAVMSLYRAKKNGALNRVALVFGYPILIVGAVLDLLVNVTLMTVIFAETPKHWLVTKRLASHKDKATWRGSLARWICANFLNPFDDGHCR